MSFPATGPGHRARSAAPARSSAPKSAATAGAPASEPRRRPAERRAQQRDVIVAVDLDRAQRGEVRGLELAVEQGEPADAQPRDQPGERDLRRVGRAADHAFAEERAAERQAVEPADQLVAVPAFDRMREARARGASMKTLLDRAVDPGVGPVVGAFGAQRDDVVEGAVGGDAEAVGGDRLAERARQVEAVERQDRAACAARPNRRSAASRASAIGNTPTA